MRQALTARPAPRLYPRLAAGSPASPASAPTRRSRTALRLTGWLPLRGVSGAGRGTSWISRSRCDVSKHRAAALLRNDGVIQLAVKIEPAPRTLPFPRQIPSAPRCAGHARRPVGRNPRTIRPSTRIFSATRRTPQRVSAWKPRPRVHRRLPSTARPGKLRLASGCRFASTIELP